MQEKRCKTSELTSGSVLNKSSYYYCDFKMEFENRS